MNGAIQITIPKKLLSLAFMLISALVLVVMGSGGASAISQPQPSATAFKWATVQSGASRPYNYLGRLSYDGRYLMFRSNSSLFVPGDTNNSYDVFVKDLQTGDIQRANVSNSGAQYTDGDNAAAMSPSGRYVTFVHTVSSVDQTYVRDLTNNTTTLASSDSSGTYANLGSTLAVSDNGKVLFFSASHTLPSFISSATPNTYTFIKDISSGAVSQVPFIDPTGNGDSWQDFEPGTFSGDGNTVVFKAFDSTTNYRTISGIGNAIGQVVAINISGNSSVMVTGSYTHNVSQSTYYVPIPNGTISYDGRYILFAHDRHFLTSSSEATLYLTDTQTGAISPVDTIPSGRTQNGGVGVGTLTSISNDGRYVGFVSSATNLDAIYNPTRYTDSYGNVVGFSLYKRDMTATNPVMVANQIVAGANAMYAPGSSSFVFDTHENIDNADPDSSDLYIAQ